MLFKQVGCVFGLLLLLSGCATVDQRAGFAEVSAVTKERTGMRVIWNAGTKLDAQVTQEVAHLVDIGLDQPGIDRERLAAHQPRRNAGINHLFEHTAQQIGGAEALVAGA